MCLVVVYVTYFIMFYQFEDFQPLSLVTFSGILFVLSKLLTEVNEDMFIVVRLMRALGVRVEAEAWDGSHRRHTTIRYRTPARGQTGVRPGSDRGQSRL